MADLKDYQKSGVSDYTNQPKSSVDSTKTKTAKESLKESVSTIEKRNLTLERQLAEMDISQKQIDKVGDNRNFFQKILNLKENQGLVTGTMALINRPAEALQGILASSFQGTNIVDEMYAGISGNKEFSLKDMGIEFDNPLLNGLGNLAFEIAADPFNFIDLPWAKLGKSGKSLAENVNQRLAMFASKTQAGQDIYNNASDLVATVMDGFKKTFGTWNDTKIKHFNNDVSNAYSIAKTRTQEMQRVNIELYNKVNELSEETLSNWGKISVPERAAMVKELNLSPNFSDNLKSKDVAQVLVAKDSFKNNLSSYLSRVIESEFTHGENLFSIYEGLTRSVPNGGKPWTEFAATSIEATKSGEIYKSIKDMMEWALKDGSVTNYNIDDYIKVSPVIRTKKGIGGDLLDATGEAITNKYTSGKRGFVVSITDDARYYFNRYFNKIKTQKLINKSLNGTNLTVHSKLLSDFTTTGKIMLDTKNPEAIEAMFEIEELYKSVTGTSLQKISYKNPNGVYEVRFAPNKAQYDYIKQLDNQLDNLDNRISGVKEKLRVYNGLETYREATVGLLEDLTTHLKGTLENDLISVFPTDSKSAAAQLEYFNKELYKPFTDLMEARKQNKEKYKFIKAPTEASEETFKLAQKGFRDSVKEWRELLVDTDGILKSNKDPFIYNFKKANITGDKLTIPLEVKWHRLEKQHKFNLIAYYIEKGVLSEQDIFSSGVKTLKDLLKMDLKTTLSIKNTEHISITLGQYPNFRDFFNVGDWVTGSTVLDVNSIEDIINKGLEHITDGNLATNRTYKRLQDTISFETALSYLSKNKATLTDDVRANIEAIELYREELRTTNISIGKQYEKYDIEQLKVLDSTYETGIYTPNETTKISQKLKEFRDTNPNETNALLENSLEQNIALSNSYNKQLTLLKQQEVALQTQLVVNDFPVLNNIGFTYQKRLSNAEITNLKKITGDVYIYRNNSGHFQYNPNIPKFLNKEEYLKVSPQIRDSLLNIENIRRIKDPLTSDIRNVNETIAEYEVALEMNRNPGMRYNRQGLLELKEQEFLRMANIVDANLLARLKPNFKNENYKIAIKEVTDSVKNITKELRKTATDLTKVSQKLNAEPKPKGREKGILVKKERQLKDKQELLKNSKAQQELKVKKLKEDDYSNLKEIPVTNTLDDVKINLNNDTWSPNSGVNEADLVYRKNEYVRPMLEDLKQVTDLMDINKLKYATADNITDGLSSLPKLFSDTVQRLAGVQMSIQGQLTRLFNDIFGLDMANWNIKGHMRHILSPEQANLAAISKAVDGKLSGVSSELFGRNLKKLGLNREYRGAATNINEAFGTNLLNTNPVEATAMMLEILPESFTLGGVFKNMMSTNVIRSVVTKESMNASALNEVVKNVTTKMNDLDKAVTKTPFQKKQMQEYKDILDDTKEYQNILKKQEKLLKEEIAANKTNTEIDTQIIPIREELNTLLSRLETYKALDDPDAIRQLEEQITLTKDRIKALEDTKISTERTPEQQALNESYGRRLEELAESVLSYSSRFVLENDSWLHNNPLFGKEYTWLRADMLNEMKKSFDLVKKAAGSENSALIESDWFQGFEDILTKIDNDEKFAIHKGVFESVKRFSNNSVKSEMGQIWSTMQKYVTIPFKKWALLSPGFLARNVFTNYSNGYLAGISPMDLHAGMKTASQEQKVFESILEEINTELLTGSYRTSQEQLAMISKLTEVNPEKARIWKDYFEMVSKGIIGNNQFSTDLVELMSKIKRSSMGRAEKSHIKDMSNSFTKVDNRLQKIFETSMKIAKNTDDWAKISMYRLVRDNDKYKHLLESFDNSPELFTKFTLFDYNNLTHAEETYMKAIFPFYTWARKNLELQLRNFPKNYKKYHRINDALNGWRVGLVGNEDNEQDYHENYIPIWNENGKITYLKFSMPFDEVDKFLDGSAIVNSLSPIIKTPLEMITGYDFFTRREFDTNGVMPGLGLGFNNLLGTTQVISDMLFKGEKPTYNEKKLAGVIGKKLIDVTQVVQNIFSFPGSMANDGFVGAVGSLFPSVFSQNEIAQSQYYNARERQQKLQEAVNFYKNKNK